MDRTRDASLSYIARTNGRPVGLLFGLQQRDRLAHLYVIGKTGTGKSTLLQNLMMQDAEAGRGFALIDPHGDLAERVVSSIPPHRQSDVIYLDVPDAAQPFGYNPLKAVERSRVPLAASGLLEAFKKHWPEAWGVRMEHVLRHALLALIECGDATLPDVLRLLTDRSYRYGIARRIQNMQVRQFWEKEYAAYPPRMRADAIAPIQNKIGSLLADPTLFRILTSPEKRLQFRSIMDSGQVLIVNLARGRIGADSAALLGSLLVTTIGLAAFSRSDIPEAERRSFYLYMDEFQNFTTLSVATMVSELRKYGVGLIMANQHLSQLSDEVQHAVLGNVGSILSFRLGPADAALLAREFADTFEPLDLLNLANHHIYVRLMIDGAVSRPFSAMTLPPWQGGHAPMSGNADMASDGPPTVRL